ncbi:MAG: 2-hydroxyhepta-2,4-diene-1,7-dioate isomerase, partial [Janthinobacterium sp.]
MKLMRYGPKGAEKPGLIDAHGAVRDLSGVLSDITGATLGKDGLATLAAVDIDSLPVVANPGRIAPPWKGV